MHNPTKNPQALAEAAGAAMFARDAASQALGMKLVEIRPGYARMTMPVRSDMLNGHQTCHGGFIFALADSAFAFACNSHNHTTVGAGCTIDYLAPGRMDDMLTAEAVEQDDRHLPRQVAPRGRRGGSDA
jgi:acyl-CoA thioesterase